MSGVLCVEVVVDGEAGDLETIGNVFDRLAQRKGAELVESMHDPLLPGAIKRCDRVADFSFDLIDESVKRSVETAEPQTANDLMVEHEGQVTRSHVVALDDFSPDSSRDRFARNEKRMHGEPRYPQRMVCRQRDWANVRSDGPRPEGLVSFGLQSSAVWSPDRMQERDHLARSRPDPTRRNRRVVARVAVALAALLFAATTPFSASAQDTEEQAREERNRVRAEKAEAARELDIAQADDAAVATALRDITDIVNAQQAEVDESSRQLELSRETAIAAEEAIFAADAEQAELEAGLANRAVAGFLNSDRGAATFFSSDDLTQAIRQTSMLEEANADTSDLLEELRIVREDRQVAESLAAEAVLEAEALELELEENLATWEVEKGVQEELKAEMAARVAVWEAEVAEFEAEDARLTEIIRAEQAKNNPVVPTSTAAPAPGTPSVSGFQWPINASVSSSFGYRVHPIFGTRRLHSGIDLGAGSGTPIAAAKSGTVIAAGWQGGYGNTVVISHGEGITSLYAHQSSIAVSVGDEVNRGDIIGFVGSTGWSTGPHLHFEIRVNGVAVDPLPYMP